MNILEQLSLYIFPKTRFRSADRHIEIRDTIENHRAVRLLLYDGVRESGMYLDEYGDRDPLFNYMKTLKTMVTHNPGLNNCLLIGGGGFIIPKLYLKGHPERRITVVEVDGTYVELAKKYFGLDTNDKRIKIVVQDGFEFIKNTTMHNAGIESNYSRDVRYSNAPSAAKYDLVIFDAYTGSSASRTILSEYALKSVYSLLSPNGIYALNMINEAQDVISMQTHLLNASLKNIFKYTRIVPCKGGGNCILMASDRKL
ncbi:spermidine synthase [Butyrivibrio sp. XPD2002]|uniref:spermidine synthase n=1 Tax=Butyrivibrio sp. XPD2002 TaxID=1280665 RepID=UPI0009DBF27C|nr:fused MFS/spermidine synthase [Butyrivibrio sp. XPD2002]